MVSLLDSVLVPINRAGWPIIAIAFSVALALGILWAPLFFVGLLALCFCTYFFRDPPRVTPQRAGLLVSPADGRLQLIEKAPPPAELGMGEEPLTRISIFLNVFDVHINRVPIGGVISGLSYRPGKFLNASLDKASELNERIRRDWSGRAERPAASSPPQRTPDGGWLSPSGNDITLVFELSRTRPPEQEGVATTAYYSAAENAYWMREGGGISGYENWYGPFALEP